MSSVQGGAAIARELPPTEPRGDRAGEGLQTRRERVTEPMEDGGVPHPTVDERAGPSDTAIARRAYELYLARGAEHGSDLDDWIQAESELRDPDDSRR